MADQMVSLAMASHPRCGSRSSLSPLLLWSMTAPSMMTTCAAAAGGGCDGTLVLRLLWRWLMGTERFFCVSWRCKNPKVIIMVTFGVSSVLLTLTHGLKWYGRARAPFCGANDHQLVAQDNAREGVYYLKSRATGNLEPLVSIKKSFDTEGTNGKWFVCFSTDSLFVIELPKRGEQSTAKEKPATVVPVSSVGSCCEYWRFSFCSFNEDHLLVRFYDSCEPTCMQFVLIDLAQTKSSGKLVVVASATPQIPNPACSNLEWGDFLNHECCACSTNSGAYSFVTMTDCGRLLAIEEGTAQVHQLSSKRYKLFASPTVISQMSPSQFCVFKRGSTYDVWDMNNPIEPLRKKCQPGFTTYEAFGEGGYLFQVSESHKEIHVSEESSGDHIITFKLFSPLHSTLSHFSFLLSSQN